MLAFNSLVMCKPLSLSTDSEDPLVADDSHHTNIFVAPSVDLVSSCEAGGYKLVHLHESWVAEGAAITKGLVALVESTKPSYVPELKQVLSESAGGAAKAVPQN
jgi:hypothetical protein